MYALALKLYALSDILKKSDRAWVGGSKRKAALQQELPEMKVFREWLSKCEEAVVQSAVEGGSKKTSSKKNKKFQQPGGGVNYTISNRMVKERSDWMHEREPYLCPNCAHAMLIIVNNAAGVRQENQLRAKEYDHSMVLWMKEGSDPKKEPVPPKGSKDEMLVCMCCVTMCKDPYTGTGCIVCEEYVKNSPERMVPWDSHLERCTCGPCCCNCSVYFPRTKWQAVEFAAVQEKERKAMEAAKKTASTKLKQTSKSIFLFVPNAH